MNSHLAGYYLYQIKVYNISLFLNKIKESNIKIYNLEKIDNYSYTFYSSIFTNKRIKDIITDYKIIGKKGLIASLFSLFFYKTTIISIIISLSFYYLLSIRIWKVSINGDSSSLIPYINMQLEKNNIKKGAKIISNEKLSEISKKILRSNNDIIEYFTLDKDGCVITANFKKKREEVEKTKYQGSLYASKDGVIKSFDIASGDIVVKINDYVKKGDLLVKDYLVTDYNETINIKTYGAVYAYTWYYVTYDDYIKNVTDEISIYSNLLINAKNDISYSFLENEYIFEENVLHFSIDNNHVLMKIHFTCVENIAKTY